MFTLQIRLQYVETNQIQMYKSIHDDDHGIW
jgi:hypothetical protein